MQSIPIWTDNITDATSSVAWGDMDNDGNLDLAAGNYSDTNKVYLNERGMLQTAAVWESNDIDYTYSMAWGDVDGDGDLDLAAGNGDGSNKVYLNEGRTLEIAATWNSTEGDQTYSVAWGDMDGDGDLDLAAGNVGQANKVYVNEDGNLQPIAAWDSSDSDETYRVVWGDMDGDGDLDLAAGNSKQPNKIYLNRGKSLQVAVWESIAGDETSCVAWGDMDGDGDLDLAAGSGDPWAKSEGAPNKVYLNEGGTLEITTTWESDGSDWTQSVAWGDMDGDGDLDLAVGNWDDLNKVYLNEGKNLQTVPVWTDGITDDTHSIAWGDIDNDGDLDLAIGNSDSSSKVYLNYGGTLGSIAAWESVDNDWIHSVTWGDVDGDSDLDLAAGIKNGPNKVYLNEEGTLEPIATWTSSDGDVTLSVAWGDMDGDGDLDLAAGNKDSPNKVYLNEGGALETIATWISDDSDNTENVVWGDADGDGDLDLAAGNWGNPNKVYLNQGNSLQTVAAWISDDDDWTHSVAWGDMDGDGDLDLAVGNDDYGAGGAPNKVYLNLRPAHPLYPGQTTAIALNLSSDPVQTFSQVITALAPANYYGVSGIRQSGLIPITYTLFHPAGEPMRSVRGFYSPDGGGRWLEAVAAPNTITTNLTTAPYPTIIASNTHLFAWDTFASGFFGQSDNVVLRIEALPNLLPITNNIPGPYQRPFVSAQTFPFRARGSQVRVMSGTINSVVPVANALVYRLHEGQPSGGTLYADAAGIPFSTDAQGYLRGRGQINVGDQLLALVPVDWSEIIPWSIESTDIIQLYYTSGAPTPTGLDVPTVAALGVQTLTISTSNPLHLFSFDVSLEWDARNDEVFMEKLEYDLRRASEYFYDFTDGQAALGEVYVFHNAENWQTAHMRIYANNRMRPNAVLGGVGSGTITDILVPTITYEAGQIRMPATWNRYGDPGETIGDDWPRTLAHEFGHYYFFLDDHYLGLDEQGQVISIDTCTNTAMTDPYRYSEYRDQEDWLPDCADTMANYLTGRSDWATIELFYPEVSRPDERDGYNDGPTLMPYEFTEITIFGPVTPTQVLEDPTFYFLDEAGQRYQSQSGTRGFLIQDDTWLLDVGEPVIDHILARGAKPGDRLCVFDAAASRLGCEDVQESDDQITLYPFPDWAPDIIVSPIETNTITVTVRITSTSVTSLCGRIFSTDAPATEIFTFRKTAGDVYETTITSTITEALLLEGFVQIWVDESAPRREMIADYAIGASPGTYRGHGEPVRGHGGTYRGHGGTYRGHGGTYRGHGVPILSSDGQVTIYTPDPTLPDEDFLTVQTATGMSVLPPGRVQIGQAYRVAASKGIINLNGASISFQYIGEAVPVGMEDYITIYYWDESAEEDGITKNWQALPTTLDLMDNFASAQMVGSGLYALLSSIQIPPFSAGWNNFGYPVPGTRPVSEALTSIADYYTSIYHYVPSSTAQWTLYDQMVLGDHPELANFINDLTELEFGHAYWIRVTEPVTLYLSGAEDVNLMHIDGLQMPPATFYGWVYPDLSNSFTPTAGVTVTAWISDTLCGQTTVEYLGGHYKQLAYKLQVRMEDGNCGTMGRNIVFEVGGRTMASDHVWDDSQAWFHPLTLTTVTVDESIIGLSATTNGPVSLGSPTTLTATITRGSNVTYTWDLGDGSVGSGSVVTHIYPSDNIYTAIVMAENSVSLVSATTTVTIIKLRIYLPLILKEGG